MAPLNDKEPIISALQIIDTDQRGGSIWLPRELFTRYQPAML